MQGHPELIDDLRQPAREGEAAPPQSSFGFRQWELAAIVFVAALLVVWLMANAADGIARTHCRSAPVLLTSGAPQRTSIVVSGTHACSLLIKSGDAVIVAATLDAPPANGSVVIRGRTQVTYRANRDFAGTDAFTVSLVARKRGETTLSTVRVDVLVR